MLLKFANRAFVRVMRPMSVTRPVALSKIDAEMVNYVNQQLEADQARALGSIKGWSTVSGEGAIGIMTKTENGETVTVRFNTNGTMPQIEEQDRLENEGKEVLCYPDFEVIIEKSGKKSMFFNCSVEDLNAPADSDAEEDADPFEIVSMAVADKELEDPYILNMDVMEDDFYDGMYAFLQSRGIDDEFIAELVNITTDMESNNYRQLLVDMKAFVQ